MTAAAPSERLLAGRVGRAHGLDGSFRVTMPRPALLALGARLWLGEREVEIVRRAGTDRDPIVRVAGLDDREAAAAHRGEELFADRAEAPALGEGEWWAEQFEGVRVHDGERAVGVVRRLVELPSCECIEVERPDGAPDLLVPLVQAAVRSVDMERGEIDIDLAYLGEAS